MRTASSARPTRRSASQRDGEKPFSGKLKSAMNMVGSSGFSHFGLLGNPVTLHPHCMMRRLVPIVLSPSLGAIQDDGVSGCEPEVAASRGRWRLTASG